MAVYEEFLDKLRWRAAHLSDVMPWRAVAAPGVILHKQTHALQRSYLMRGPDLTSEVQEVMGALMLQANNVFKRLRGQWTVHTEAQRVRVTDYPLGLYHSPGARLIDQSRRRAILADPGTFETVYYLTLTWQPPHPIKSVWSNVFLSGSSPSTGQQAGVGDFLNQADYLVYLLRGMLAVGRSLMTDDTLSYLHNCVSDRWHPVRLPALPIDIDVMLCDRPWHGGWYPYFGTAPLVPGAPDDRTHVRICSIQSYPPQSLANAMQAIDHLRFPYRWSTRWIAMERQTQEYLLARTQRQWYGQRKSMRDILMEKASRQETAILNTTAENFATDADEARQEVGADVVAFGDFSSEFVTWHRNAEAAEAQLEDAMNIFDARGFVTIKEREHATAAWLASMPGNRADSVRRTPQHSLTLAHLAPGLAAAWTGPERDEYLDAPPWFFAHTEGSTLFRAVNHLLGVGHTLILGPTGSGKSTLLGLMTAQWLARYRNAQAFVFDVGRTARCMCHCLGGYWYDLGSESVAFQPLARCDEPDWQRWGFDWLVSLMDDAQLPITGSRQAYLLLGLERLAQNPVRLRTLTELEMILTALSRQTEVSASKRTALQEKLMTEHMEIRQTIHPLTKAGAHGNLLDSDHDDLQHGSLHVFEQEELLTMSHFVGPVTRYLFHAVQERFSTDTPTWLPMDEAAIAWIVPQEGETSRYKLSTYGEQGREWMMTTRKRGVSLGFFTHSISQVFTSALGALLMESCPTWYMLPNKAANSPELADIYRRMGFNDRQINLITTARLQRDVYYRAEGLGKRMLSVELSPVELAMLARNDEEDHRLMDAILAQHGHEGFAKAWLEAQGYPGAFDEESSSAAD